MTFDWQRYLILADSLHLSSLESQNDEEACLRAAISRGYYGAFCTARNLARDRDQIILHNNGNDHSFINNHYLNSNDGRRKSIGVKLKRLKDWRGDADYEDEVNDLKKSTEAALTLAHDVIVLLEKTYGKI